MRTPSDHGTRERILEVAEASLAQQGYYGTRLHQIAEQVGIQKASLFHYFPSKQHLYRAVIEQGFGETEQTLRHDAEGGAVEKIRALVEAYVDTVAAHPERTKIFLRQSLGDVPSSGEQASESQRLLTLVIKFVAEGQKAKIFQPIDAVALVLGVVGMVAFFFTSAPVVAPALFGDPFSVASIARVKRHVTEVVQRCLGVGAACAGASRAVA